MGDFLMMNDDKYIFITIAVIANMKIPPEKKLSQHHMNIHFPMNFKAKLRNFRFHLHCNNKLQAISIANILLPFIFVIV